MNGCAIAGCCWGKAPKPAEAVAIGGPLEPLAGKCLLLAGPTSTPASQIWPVTPTSDPQVTDIFLPMVPEAHQWQQPRLVLEPSLSSNRLWHTRSCKQQRFYLYIDILIRGLKCNNDEVIVSTRTYEVKWCDKSTNLDKLVLSIDFCGGLIWYFISAVLSKVLFWNNYSYSLFSKTWRWKINDHKG
jgi:hypothetical protein